MDIGSSRDWLHALEREFPDEERRAEYMRNLLNDRPNNLTSAGSKLDAGKPTFRLIPPRALLFVAQVLEYGARKYSPDNWRKVENLQERYLDAALRHINAYQRSEFLDEQSKLPHLAHAVTSLLFMLEDAALWQEAAR